MHDDEEAIKCARSQREKRRNKKVVPSWIFFACGGPKTPIHLRRHSRVRKIAGGKTDGSTPIHREMMTCASRFPKLKKRAFCLPFSRGLKLLRFRGKMCRGNRPRFSPDETCDFTPVFSGRGSKAHTGGIFELRIGSQLRLSE